MNEQLLATDLTNLNSLLHYGRKGMRWGKHRFSDDYDYRRRNERGQYNLRNPITFRQASNDDTPVFTSGQAPSNASNAGGLKGGIRRRTPEKKSWEHYMVKIKPHLGASGNGSGPLKGQTSSGSKYLTEETEAAIRANHQNERLSKAKTSLKEKERCVNNYNAAVRSKITYLKSKKISGKGSIKNSAK